MREPIPRVRCAECFLPYTIWQKAAAVIIWVILTSSNITAVFYGLFSQKTEKEKTMKKGFTLIELLVVVLIVGILAAVAMPQYQKAVEKAKAAEAMTVLNKVVQNI